MVSLTNGTYILSRLRNVFKHYVCHLQVINSIMKYLKYFQIEEKILLRVLLYCYISLVLLGNLNIKLKK